MSLEIVASTRFRKDLKKSVRRGFADRTYKLRFPTGAGYGKVG